jgi:natural product precursor
MLSLQGADKQEKHGNLQKNVYKMKKLQKLKLNAFREQYLVEKQMNALRGGNQCSCSCYYANYGGSSTSANMGANYNLGSGYSTNGCNQYTYVSHGGGIVIYEPYCNESVPV